MKGQFLRSDAVFLSKRKVDADLLMHMPDPDMVSSANKIETQCFNYWRLAISKPVWIQESLARDAVTFRVKLCAMQTGSVSISCVTWIKILRQDMWWKMLLEVRWCFANEPCKAQWIPGFWRQHEVCTAFQTWGHLCPRPYLYIDILISQSRLEHGSLEEQSCT